MTKNVLIPLNEVDRLHWTFAEVQIDQKCIVYYDSFHTSGAEILENILDFIEKEATKFKKPFDRSSWKLCAAYMMPKQLDGVR